MIATTAVVPGQFDDYSKVEATGSLTNNYPESIFVSVGRPPYVMAIDSAGMLVLPVNYGGFNIVVPAGTARPDRAVIEPGATLTWTAASVESRGGMPSAIAAYVLDEYNPATIGATWKDNRTALACGSLYVPQRR
ncbi:MAG: hypothetical protein HHJ11_07185 [Phycicoccus sp.]|nr:hypothetical protein [Phycicoccus sp.]